MVVQVLATAYRTTVPHGERPVCDKQEGAQASSYYGQVFDN